MSFAAIGAFVTTYAGAIAAASAVVGIGAAVAQGDASRRAAHTNADIARERGKIAANQANVNEDAQRRRGAMYAGKAAAAAAEGSGLSGTNIDLIKQGSADAEMDALNIRYGGQLGVLSSNEQANLADMQANDASTATYLNAGAAALSSAGSYASGTRKAPAPTGGG